jgi:hypothetical protein
MKLFARGRHGTIAGLRSCLPGIALPITTCPQGCSLSAPASALVFHPQRGNEVIDARLGEQLIAPTLEDRESDGTPVFHASGGTVAARTSEGETTVFDDETSNTQVTMHTESDDRLAFSWALNLLFAITSAIMAANQYHSEQILGGLAQSFNVTHAQAAWIPFLVQAG